MRKAGLVGALALLLGTGCVRHAVPLVTHQTRTFPAAADKLVRLDVRSFDVDVRVTEAATISVTVDLDARSSSRGAARRWVEDNTPVFDDSSSALEVRVPTRGRGLFIIGFLHTNAKLELVVPPTCRLEVRTSSGDVAISGTAALAGTVRVRTSSGDLNVTGGLRELVARTSSGDVRVTGQPLTVLEADTSSGDITLEAGSERAIVDTTSGDVRLEKLTGDLSADATSGEVRASWDGVPAGKKLRVHTSSGDVHLRIPRAVALKGEIHTSSGSITSDIEGSSGDRGHRLSFSAPGESPDLDVRTSSGDVSVHTHG